MSFIYLCIYIYPYISFSRPLLLRENDVTRAIQTVVRVSVWECVMSVTSLPPQGEPLFYSLSLSPGKLTRFLPRRYNDRCLGIVSHAHALRRVLSCLLCRRRRCCCPGPFPRDTLRTSHTHAREERDYPTERAVCSVVYCNCNNVRTGGDPLRTRGIPTRAQHSWLYVTLLESGQ